MIALAPTTRVYLACRPIDLRKGLDGLAAQVANVLQADPFSGHLFVFRGKRGDYLKLVYWPFDKLRRLRAVPVRQAAGERPVCLAAHRRRPDAVDTGADGSADRGD